MGTVDPEAGVHKAGKEGYRNLLKGIIYMLLARTGVLRLLARLMLDRRVPKLVKAIPVLAWSTSCHP